MKLLNTRNSGKNNRSNKNLETQKKLRLYYFLQAYITGCSTMVYVHVRMLPLIYGMCTTQQMIAWYMLNFIFLVSNSCSQTFT